MAKTKLHLHESKDGWFSYRRRVPAKLQALLDKTEVKHAYKTKSKVQALKLHASHHEQVEKEFATARAFLKGIASQTGTTKYQTPSKIHRDVYASLSQKGLLPHQIPTPNSSMSDVDQMAWSADHLKYMEASTLYEADAISYDEYEEALDSLTFEPFKKFVNQREYIRYLEETEDTTGLPDHGVVTLKILKGEYSSPDPTIEDLFNHYIDYSRTKVANVERNARQQKKLEGDVERLANFVYSAHSDGKETLIDNLDMIAIGNSFTVQYPRVDTRRRNYTQLAAAVNLWNRRNKKQKIDNPFEELKDELPRSDPKARVRRVWHPKEYHYFWQSIRQETDPSKRILGMLMAYAGKAQGETQGLLRNDVVLNHDVPHIKYSDNQLRVIGKKRIQHSLPLVGDLLIELQKYISSFEGGQFDPLFPTLVRKGSGDLSKILNKHRREFHPVKDTLFQNYGLRHTFKPRYEEAGVSSLNGMYLFGHKTNATSATHDDYAKGLFKSEEFKSLRDDMERVMNVTTWNYNYMPSDFD
jgi:hypothetical protein